MADSPFLRHRRRKLAAITNPEAASTTVAPRKEDTPQGREYAALKVQLDDHKRQLKDIASHKQRQPKKAEFAKTYSDWVEGVLDADEPVQDDILLTNMIWAMDYGDFAQAVRLGKFALKHGLAMPEEYSRSVACFLREDIAALALADLDHVSLELLTEVDQLTAEGDMPDPAKAKLNKALGRKWAEKAAKFDPTDDNAPAGGAASYIDQALAHHRRALELHAKAGVKKDIERLEKMQRDLATLKD